MTPSRDERLANYREKRVASRTPEPFGGRVVAGGSIFVVQKHAARNLHWDLRLELDGVLLSWAIPKGPSPNQADKRLAMQTEDHPLEYAEFEGVIPEGEYGAGAMIVWDRGVWVPIEDPREGLEKGKLLFELHGHKLLGKWTLVKTKQAPNSWLFIKERDAYLDEDASTEDYPDDSIYSGLTVEEFPHADAHAEAVAERVGELGARERIVRAADVKLMLASPEERPFTRDGWIFELKYDGYRLLAERSGREPFLRSRAGHDLTATFPEIARAMRGLPFEDLVLDGEVVVNDAEGKPSFSRLQRRGRILKKLDALKASVRLPAVYHAFDILGIEGYDLRGLPLLARKEVLRAVLPTVGPIRYTDHIRGTGRGDVHPGRAHATRGHRREKGGCTLPWRSLEEVDQDSHGTDRGLRRRRLDRAEGGEGRLRGAPYRSVRGRRTRLPRECGKRIQGLRPERHPRVDRAGGGRRVRLHGRPDPERQAAPLGAARDRRGGQVQGDDRSRSGPAALVLAATSGQGRSRMLDQRVPRTSRPWNPSRSRSSRRKPFRSRTSTRFFGPTSPTRRET